MKEQSIVLDKKLAAAAALKKVTPAPVITAEIPINPKGTFKATIFDESEAEDVTGTFRFKNGTCRVLDGKATIVYSEYLMKVSNDEELGDDEIALCPQIALVEKAVAVKTLQSFVDLDASFIERIA